MGYSDGGIIALLVARSRPDFVRSLVLIGTNYHFDGVVPGVFDDLGPDSELVASSCRNTPSAHPMAPITSRL